MPRRLAAIVLLAALVISLLPDPAVASPQAGIPAQTSQSSSQAPRPATAIGTDETAVILAADEALFEKHVEKSDGAAVVLFYAPWCGPCRALIKTLVPLAKQHRERVRTLAVNIDDVPALAIRFGTRSIPMVVGFDRGKASGGVLLGNVDEKALAELYERLGTGSQNPVTSQP